MTDPVVLGLDTASTVSVGLARGPVVLGEAYVVDRMAHVEQLVPLLRGVLVDAGLTVSAVTTIVVGLGPGPFTGLRVGIVTARVLAAVGGAALHGVCSLDVLAAEHAEQATGEFLVASDARRQEVYWAHYAADGHRLAGPAVGRPETLPPLPVVGSAASLVVSSGGGVAAAGGPTRLSAAALAVAGAALPSAGTEPLYLRRPDAAEPGRRKRVLLARPGDPAR